MSAITRARTALQNLHREHLTQRMGMNDIPYCEVTNAMFKLLDRMEKEESE